MFVYQRVMNHPQQSFTDGFTTTNQVCIFRLSWFEGYLFSHGRPTTSQLIGMVGWLNGWPFACQIHVPPQKCFERSTHLYQLLHIPSCQGSDIFTSSDPSHIHIFWGLVRTQIWATTFFITDPAVTCKSSSMATSSTNFFSSETCATHQGDDGNLCFMGRS